MHGPECCDAPTVQESEFQDAVVKSFNSIFGGKKDMLAALEDDTSMESIDAKLEEQQQELLKRANAGQDCEDLADEIDCLRGCG